MIFNSIEFLIFFPIVVLVYYVIPQKFRYFWLLMASWYFYMNWNPVYLLLLLFCTVVSYGAGLLLEKKKSFFYGALVVLLAVLGFFKYFDFGLVNVNRIFSLFHIEPVSLSFSIVLPVGISFYTLQSIGYLIDVYRGDIYAERNFLRYALFVSFFPQLVAGPIERSKHLLVQLYKPKSLSWEDFTRGILLMMWGLFLKLVIADRAAIVVNTVYEDSAKYQGVFILVATVLFAIQIYCDFYGYSIIAKGCALLFGIELMDNFAAPYFATSIQEFWRRWHISLSGWFRDYLYIPLGGNRKGWLRQQWNLCIVFGVSGLWHGASIAFIVWGLLHGIYQVIGNIGRKLFRNRQTSFSHRLLQRIMTFLLVCFAWLFFRAGDMSDALDLIRNMNYFNPFILFDGSLYELGVGREMFWIMTAAIGLLCYVDYKKYCGVDVVAALRAQEAWFKVFVYVGLFFATILFGCYGVEYDTSEFIYFQF